MHAQSASSKVRMTERRILRALCSGACGADSNLIRYLSAYCWIDSEHRIVFEALAKISPCDALSLRELLPSQTTRAGFPDVNWDLYFAHQTTQDSDVRRLVRELMP
jgi:hypothetical protein